jgi:DNA repair photolyase
MITRDNGERVEGIAPVIVSASRSTDIPGCYGEWFVNRLNKGYIVWKNPFNGMKQYVSFEKTRCIVFWTKNPAPFIKHIESIQKMGIGIVFQVTLNDYEDEKLELNLPSLQQRFHSLKTLSSMIGREKVLWRFDPLILTDQISKDVLLKKISSVGTVIHPFVGRLTISFLSLYKKVLRNLDDVSAHEISDQVRLEIARGINGYNQNWKLPLFSCAEPLDLSMYGIFHGSCIDSALIVRCFGDDPLLQTYFRISKSSNLFGKEEVRFESKKDSGQRDGCGCCISKDIGTYDTCFHGCRYCYANTSPEKAMYLKGHAPDDEFINVK